MGQFYDTIPESLIPWIRKQEMFFVATAPLSETGHVNVSPKGLHGTFHVVNPTRAWYQDCTGSGVETISHLRENRRITIMFCAYEGAARILRLFGTGTVHEFGTPEYNELITPDQRLPGSRAAIVIDVHKVGTSCGFAVPLYTFKSHRTALTNIAENMEIPDRKLAEDQASCETEEVLVESGKSRVYPKDGMKGYWAKSNAKSIDGLPGLNVAPFVDVVPRAGVVPKGVAEPPSDGSVVILGVKFPRERVRLLLEPTSKEEVVRLGTAFVLGVFAAAFYGRLLNSSEWHTKMLSL